jgi:hypothetical protein
MRPWRKTAPALFGELYYANAKLVFFLIANSNGRSSKTPARRAMVFIESGTEKFPVPGTGTCWPLGLEAHGEGGLASDALASPGDGGRSDSNVNGPLVEPAGTLSGEL